MSGCQLLTLFGSDAETTGFTTTTTTMATAASSRETGTTTLAGFRPPSCCWMSTCAVVPPSYQRTRPVFGCDQIAALPVGNSCFPTASGDSTSQPGRCDPADVRMPHRSPVEKGPQPVVASPLCCCCPCRDSSASSPALMAEMPSTEPCRLCPTSPDLSVNSSRSVPSDAGSNHRSTQALVVNNCQIYGQQPPCDPTHRGSSPRSGRPSSQLSQPTSPTASSVAVPQWRFRAPSSSVQKRPTFSSHLSQSSGPPTDLSDRLPDPADTMSVFNASHRTTSTTLSWRRPLPSTSLWSAMYSQQQILLSFLVLVALMTSTDACSSRSTPKPRPPSPTLRPNITFQTYACPPAYAAWYCLNGATCFTVKIGISILYNCECADGFMGQRCEFKDLDGTYLPTREKLRMAAASQVQTSTASSLPVGLVAIVLLLALAALAFTKRRTKLKLSRIEDQMNRQDEPEESGCDPNESRTSSYITADNSVASFASSSNYSCISYSPPRYCRDRSYWETSDLSICASPVRSVPAVHHHPPRSPISQLHSPSRRAGVSQLYPKVIASPARTDARNSRRHDASLQAVAAASSSSGQDRLMSISVGHGLIIDNSTMTTPPRLPDGVADAATPTARWQSAGTPPVSKLRRWQRSLWPDKPLPSGRSKELVTSVMESTLSFRVDRQDEISSDAATSTPCTLPYSTRTNHSPENENGGDGC